jgi:hypothetical protein
MGSGSIVAHILNLGSSWRKVISFMPLYFWGKAPWYAWNRGLGGPQSHCGSVAKRKKVFLCTRNWTLVIQHIALSLYWLSYSGSLHNILFKHKFRDLVWESNYIIHTTVAIEYVLWMPRVSIKWNTCCLLSDKNRICIVSRFNCVDFFIFFSEDTCSRVQLAFRKLASSAD